MSIQSWFLTWPIGCLKLQVILSQKATNYRALLRKMITKDKGLRSEYTDLDVLCRMTIQSWFLTWWAQRVQHTATHCNTLQHTATHCNTPQHTATHCNTLQHTAIFASHLHTLCTPSGRWLYQEGHPPRLVAVCCSALQCVAVCCRVCMWHDSTFDITRRAAFWECANSRV